MEWFANQLRGDKIAAKSHNIVRREKEQWRDLAPCYDQVISISLKINATKLLHNNAFITYKVYWRVYPPLVPLHWPQIFSGKGTTAAKQHPGIGAKLNCLQLRKMVLCECAQKQYFHSNFPCLLEPTFRWMWKHSSLWNHLNFLVLLLNDNLTCKPEETLKLDSVTSSRNAEGTFFSRGSCPLVFWIIVGTYILLWVCFACWLHIDILHIPYPFSMIQVGVPCRK